MKVPLLVAALVSAIAVLLYLVIAEGSVPSYRVSEIVAPGFSAWRDEARTKPRTVRVEGFIWGIEREGDPLRFTVIDKRKDEAATFRAESDAVRPDVFKVGAEVTLQGSYDPNGKLFRAEHIWTKCPSKYQELQYAEKEKGLGGYDPKKHEARTEPKGL